MVTLLVGFFLFSGRGNAGNGGAPGCVMAGLASTVIPVEQEGFLGLIKSQATAAIVCTITVGMTGSPWQWDQPSTTCHTSILQRSSCVCAITLIHRQALKLCLERAGKKLS